MKSIFSTFLLFSIICVSCNEDCCDCCGDQYPDFQYQDTRGNDLLSPTNSQAYNMDSIYFEIIQNSTRIQALPELSGGEIFINQDKIITPNVLHFKYWLIEGFKIEADLTDTLLIHLNAVETDTIVWKTYFHPKTKFIHTKDIKVNGIPRAPNGGGFITIIKNR